MQACSRHGSLYRSNVVRYSFHLTCLYGTDLCCTYLLAHLSLCLWPCEGHRANECLRLADGQVCGPTALTKLLCGCLKSQSFSRSSQFTLLDCCVTQILLPPLLIKQDLSLQIVHLKNPSGTSQYIFWELSFFPRRQLVLRWVVRLLHGWRWEFSG